MLIGIVFMFLAYVVQYNAKALIISFSVGVMFLISCIFAYKYLRNEEV